MSLILQFSFINSWNIHFTRESISAFKNDYCQMVWSAIMIGPHLYLDKEGSMVDTLVEKKKRPGPITIVGHAIWQCDDHI